MVDWLIRVKLRREGGFLFSRDGPHNIWCVNCLYTRHEHVGDRKRQKPKDNSLLFLLVRYLLEEAISGEMMIRMHGCVVSSF